MLRPKSFDIVIFAGYLVAYSTVHDALKGREYVAA